MATYTNLGARHVPVIKRNIFGLPVSERSTIKLPAIDSSAFYLGSMVGFVAGNATGAEFGVRPMGDDDLILGIAVGFTRTGSLLSIFEDDKKAGTVTAATGELPVKYTFSASNDESNTTSAVKELVEVLPLMAGDIVEMTTWGASTESVARGTTTAAGSAGSSANIGVGMSVNATYPFALLESSASTTLANLDFITTEIDGQKPVDPNRVYVLCLRSMMGPIAALS